MSPRDAGTNARARRRSGLTAKAARPLSAAEFRAARDVLVGGVDSPVRSFVHVGGSPVFIDRGRGPYLYDVDGRRYLDLLNSWGAIILGHAPARVVRAVERAAHRGLTFGAPTSGEHELASRIRNAVPRMERLRFVNSGTEATMSAVRVARGFTRRDLVVKFAGGYHGHSDGLLARSGSGVAAQSLPDSAGVPSLTVKDTLVSPYNDLEGVRSLFDTHGDSIAAVLVEPIAANMGLVLPQPDFLPGLTKLCREHGALLIADEVITGFRLRRGTIHESLGAQADLVTLGKVIGGGLPVGAYGGRRDVMEQVAPLGPVYQAGTLSGNPVAIAAGAATLDLLDAQRYRRLERVGQLVEDAFREDAAAAGVAPFTVVRIGSLLGLFFLPAAPRNLEEATATDWTRFARLFHAALDRGIYLPPSPLECLFLSTALTEAHVSRMRRGLAAAFLSVAKGGR